jgi:guanyl-specific ribonuclease Sa
MREVERSRTVPARRASTSGPAVTRAMALQRSMGNRALSRVLSGQRTPVIQRELMDDEHMDEFHEVDIAKREARLADLGSQKLVSGRKKNAVDDLIGGRARDAASAKSKKDELGTELQGIEGAGSVSGRAKGGKLEKTIESRAKTGPIEDPNAKLEQSRLKREAKARYDGKVAKLTKFLEPARLHAGTEEASVEVAQHDVAVATKDWIEADQLADQIILIAEASLKSAFHRAAGLGPDVKSIKTFPACHRPPDLKERTEALTAAYNGKDWIGIASKFNDLEEVVRKALSFHSRLEAIKSATATLDNEARKKNMDGWIAEHEAMTWDQVEASADKTSDNHTLRKMEERLADYAGRDALASKSAASAVARAAADAAAAVERARVREELRSNGLIGGNGATLVQKTLADLEQAEERPAVERVLDAIDAGTVYTPTDHPNGAKWADYHGNNAGKLPGVARAGGYKEYYVDREPGWTKYHGSRRIVTHNATGRAYYTKDHYDSFVRIR